jgi:hypothetical protein
MAFGINTLKTRSSNMDLKLSRHLKQIKNILKIVQLSNSKHDQFPKQFFTSNVV